MCDQKAEAHPNLFSELICPLPTLTVSSDSMFLTGSKRFSFILPASTTNTQSSMVMEVSARFVDITIFRTPRFGLEKTYKRGVGMG